MTVLPAYLAASAVAFHAPTRLPHLQIMMRVGAAASATPCPDFAQPTQSITVALRRLELLRRFHLLEGHVVRESTDELRPGFVVEVNGRFVAAYEILSVEGE